MVFFNARHYSSLLFILSAMPTITLHSCLCFMQCPPLLFIAVCSMQCPPLLFIAVYGICNAHHYSSLLFTVSVIPTITLHCCLWCMKCLPLTYTVHYCSYCLPCPPLLFVADDIVFSAHHYCSYCLQFPPLLLILSSVPIITVDIVFSAHHYCSYCLQCPSLLLILSSVPTLTVHYC